MNSTARQPSCIVIGAGAVGVIAAYSLSRAHKCTVSLVVRSDYDHVMKQGYQIDSCDYGFIQCWKPNHVYQSAVDAACSKIFFDYIIVTVKNIPDGPVQDRISEIVRPIVDSNRNLSQRRLTNILLIQNGIDIEKEVLNNFEETKYNLSLLSGVQMIASTKIGPGNVQQSGRDSISIGAFNCEDHRAVSSAHEFVSIYQNEGCNYVDYDPNVRYTRWRKLLYNATISTTTTLAGLDALRCIEFGQDQKGTEVYILRPAMKEIIAIAASEGIYLGDDQIEHFLKVARKLIYKPSMCVDFEKGRLMELEVILGHPIRIAQSNEIQTPTLMVLYHLLTLLQAKVKESKGLIGLEGCPPILVENSLN